MKFHGIRILFVSAVRDHMECAQWLKDKRYVCHAGLLSTAAIQKFSAMQSRMKQYRTFHLPFFISSKLQTWSPEMSHLFCAQFHTYPLTTISQKPCHQSWNSLLWKDFKAEILMKHIPFLHRTLLTSVICVAQTGTAKVWRLQITPSQWLTRRIPTMLWVSCFSAKISGNIYCFFVVYQNQSGLFLVYSHRKLFPDSSRCRLVINAISHSSIHSSISIFRLGCCPCPFYGVGSTRLYWTLVLHASLAFQHIDARTRWTSL